MRRIKPITAGQRWKQLQKAEMAVCKEITTYAKQVQQETGCTWGEAIRVAENRHREDRIKSLQ